MYLAELHYNYFSGQHFTIDVIAARTIAGMAELIRQCCVSDDASYIDVAGVALDPFEVDHTSDLHGTNLSHLEDLFYGTGDYAVFGEGHTGSCPWDPPTWLFWNEDEIPF